MPDSSDIRQALIAKLTADGTLLSYMPNGVSWVVAPQNGKQFVRVSLAAPGHTKRFEGRSHYSYVYLVEAVALSTELNANLNAKNAAARIDALLDPPTGAAQLTVAGLTLMAMFLDPDLDVVDEIEQDEVDATVKWFRRGGYYRVVMST